MRRPHLLLVLGAALALGSCDGPTAGELVAELTSPAEFGALQFVVRAVEPQTVDTVTTACTGCRTFLVRVSGSEVRGVLLGSIRQGPVLRIHVSDVDLPEAYRIELIQGAAPNHGVLPVSGSSVRIPVLP